MRLSHSGLHSGPMSKDSQADVIAEAVKDTRRKLESATRFVCAVASRDGALHILHSLPSPLHLNRSKPPSHARSHVG